MTVIANRVRADADPIFSPSAEGFDRTTILCSISDGSRPFPENWLNAVLDRYRHDVEVQRALLARDDLPLSIVERLGRLVTDPGDLDRLRNQLVVRNAEDSIDPRSVRCRPDWWPRPRF